MACSCGFSRSFPVCDGTHKIVKEVRASIVIKILDELRKCTDVVENDTSLYCTKFKDHPKCEKTNELLYLITGNKIYLIPDIIK